MTVVSKTRLLATLTSLKGLGEVEALITEKLVSEAPLLTEIGTYLLNLGGKRMRPVLTLMTAKAFGLKAPSPAIIQVAAGIELIHMATLLHDDIIDKSPLRRHKESAYLKFGIDTTLLTGDFLLTRAFSLCAHLDTFTIEATERACVYLTEGEILETPIYKEKHTKESSLLIARKKTASLFQLAALCGGHLAGNSNEVSSLLSDFGESLGIAFQILDDILDVTAAEDLLGKKSGMDLKERKPSIINVLWLMQGTPLSSRLLEPCAENEESFYAAAIEEIRGSSVIAEAQALASFYTGKARESLKKAFSLAPHIDENACKDLLSLVDYTTSRTE